MSGHNKWSTIKHKKAKTDAAKGKSFTKVIREINVAVREGGPDPEMNARLRLAIDNAKKVNMPNDNVKKAIQRAGGAGEGIVLEEIIYEGFAPCGVAILIKAMTDNRNRSLTDIRTTLTKAGGILGESGSVSWMFHKKGMIIINDQKTKEEDVFDMVIDAGAEDIATEDDGSIEIKTEVSEFYKVQKALEGKGIVIDSAEITYLPDNTVLVADVESATKVLKAIDRLDEVDDVQNVYANFDIPEDVLIKVEV